MVQVALQVDNICVFFSPMKESTGLFPVDFNSIIKTSVFIVSNPDTFLSMHMNSAALQVKLSSSPPAT